MAIEVKIPAVGESITSGLLSAWLKKEGEMVKDGESILMLETDKISTEIPAPGTGVLRIEVEAGQEVKIGQVVATLDQTAKAGTPPASQGETPGTAQGTETMPIKAESSLQLRFLNCQKNRLDRKQTNGLHGERCRRCARRLRRSWSWRNKMRRC